MQDSLSLRNLHSKNVETGHGLYVVIHTPTFMTWASLPVLGSEAAWPSESVYHDPEKQGHVVQTKLTARTGQLSGYSAQQQISRCPFPGVACKHVVPQQGWHIQGKPE